MTLFPDIQKPEMQNLKSKLFFGNFEGIWNLGGSRETLIWLSWGMPLSRKDGGLFVGTSSATMESRVELDGSSVCPTPSPSMPHSYAQVVAGATTSGASGSLVRSQRSEVNFHRSC